MDEGVLESMAQDEAPEQEMLVVEEQELPQTDPEPEMGAAAAAVYDTSPPPLHQNPPILAESAQPSTPDMARLFAVLAQMEANTNEMKNDMKDEMKKMRGEMRNMGRSLQVGMKAITCSETQTARKKMATPRAGTNELEGSAPAGEDRVIRETCWARSVKVTETVTERGKLIGVTKTCTSETRRDAR